MAHCVHCGSHAIAGLGDFVIGDKPAAEAAKAKKRAAQARIEEERRKAAEEAGYTVPSTGGSAGGSSSTLMYVGVAGLLAAGVFFAMKDKKGGG